MNVLATPIRIGSAFDDPGAIRTMVERNGPYASIASYLPASATRGVDDNTAQHQTPAWFRGNWAINGVAAFSGVDVILHNPRYLAAASQLFDGRPVRPTTVVVNVNPPMPAGAIHLDIPSFRGANRDQYPLQLLQAMGTSGLFEAWRVVEAGAITWFYDGPGGAYDYWPEGLDGPMQSERPPFDNVALVADNDRMYHRIGWVGDPDAVGPAISPAATIRHLDDATWAITDADETTAIHPDEQVRISVLWKAQVADTPSGDVAAPLTASIVVDTIAADLRSRGVDRPIPDDPLADLDWIDLVHSVYYPSVRLTD